jgi:transposase-like protein
MKEIQCPHCTNKDMRMIDKIGTYNDMITYTCEVCSKLFTIESTERMTTNDYRKTSKTIVRGL